MRSTQDLIIIGRGLAKTHQEVRNIQLYQNKLEHFENTAWYHHNKRLVDMTRSGS
jgi:hypothetical protein